MRRFWEFLYDLLRHSAPLADPSAMGLFNAKVRRGIEGRKNLFEELAPKVSTLPRRQASLVSFLLHGRV